MATGGSSNRGDDFYARGLAQLHALEETITLEEDDEPETVYDENRHWYAIAVTNRNDLPRNIPNDTRQWLERYGVSDAPDIVSVTIRAVNPSNPDADPVFQAFCSINNGFMFITYMNRGGWSTDNIYASNHPLARRAYMSEWIYRTWRTASDRAGQNGQELPPLHQVAIANINNVIVSGAIEDLRSSSAENEGELLPVNEERRFVTLFGTPLVRAVPRALWSMSRSFRRHFPTRIAWRSGGGLYAGEGHTGQEIELDDRFLVVSLAPLRPSRARREEVVRRVRAAAAEELRIQQQTEGMSREGSANTDCVCGK
ncbi:hypothetical protein MCOR04_006878 [Pyricularia oryzae]|nr:hypothetical protein MCOR17_006865 [Pyricularia oryzae]KAI6505118.1 hypothetical protein MCOR13_004450 [Pyricularia oryzae]KAI6576093.1 hypothetical protein MCOR04_006878 [Pyricularia oryzae]